jgi:glucose-1-phosphate adenylyltransferase
MLCNIIACILTSEEGTPLFPLTVDRTKPVMRFEGSYRLIDLTLSNCINSDIRQIFIFPQCQTQGLQDHLRQGWSFLSQGREAYVMSVPPPRVGHWEYQGTADAVYQNLSLLERINPTHVLILGSNHLYQMDYRHLLEFHQRHGADVTVATFPVPRHQTSQFGMLTANPLGEVTSFLEKPCKESTLPAKAPAELASMGIYLFRFAVLREVLGEDAQRQSTHDLGREILPGMLGRYRVAAFPFVEGMGKAPAYWRGGDTIDTYGEAHMDLVSPQADFQLSQPQGPLCVAPAPGPSTSFGFPGDLGSARGKEGDEYLYPTGMPVSRRTRRSRDVRTGRLDRDGCREDERPSPLAHEALEAVVETGFCGFLIK